MAASVRVILSARAIWAFANDADVEENVRTTSMMVRKSRVEIVICCGGGAELKPEWEITILRVPEPEALQNAPLKVAAPP